VYLHVRKQHVLNTQRAGVQGGRSVGLVQSVILVHSLNVASNPQTYDEVEEKIRAVVKRVEEEGIEFLTVRGHGDYPSYMSYYRETIEKAARYKKGDVDILMDLQLFINEKKEVEFVFRVKADAHKNYWRYNQVFRFCYKKQLRTYNDLLKFLMDKN